MKLEPFYNAAAIHLLQRHFYQQSSLTQNNGKELPNWKQYRVVAHAPLKRKIIHGPAALDLKAPTTKIFA